MSYTLSTFADLIATYPTWASLEAFLTSEEGGKLRIVKNDSPLAIIRYTKGVSKDVPHLYAFRSVVWNTETNRPVSVSPVKSSPYILDGAHMQISEFLDGIMLQGFYGTNGEPLTATRTILGSTNKFYTDRSFAELLEDATVTVGGTSSFLKNLPAGSFVNLLLQHPEHKTITALAQPRLYVTHIGTVGEDGTVTVTYDPSTWADSFKPYAPRVYDTLTCTSKENFTDAMAKYNPSPTGHVWQGLVFQEVGSERRYRIRTDNYMKVRSLRGFEAQMYERFLRLRRLYLTKEYVRYFPEDNKELWNCEMAFRNISNLLMDSYTKVFKLKENTFKDFHVSLRPHMYALHGQYINSLKEGEPYPVVYSGVVEYINNLSLDDQKNLMRHLMYEEIPVRSMFVAEPVVVEATANK